LATVASFFANKALAQVDRDAAERAMARVGLTHETLADPMRQVPIEQHHALFETLAEGERPDIGFHMRTSGSMRCEDYGPVGLTLKSAPTLRRSFERLDRYARMFNPYAIFSFSDRGEECWWINSRGAVKRDGFRLSNEAAMGTFVALLREANGDEFSPKRVQFSHQPVGSIGPLEAYFRCPVTFGAEVDAIVMRRHDMDRPNRVGDQPIWNFLRRHLEQSLGMTEEDRIDREVVIQVTNALSEGVPRLEDIASVLGIGSRTLQRRLSELGHSYQSLVDEARREAALKLVAEGRHALAEIAFLTGFAEQSSFTRAFKRWFGTTPRAYREQASR
jgi:AraC-like DNA-binding protein